MMGLKRFENVRRILKMYIYLGEKCCIQISHLKKNVFCHVRIIVILIIKTLFLKPLMTYSISFGPKQQFVSLYVFVYTVQYYLGNIHILNCTLVFVTKTNQFNLSFKHSCCLLFLSRDICL